VGPVGPGVEQLVFKARYAGKCVCGCGGSFAPGTTIMGTRGNYKIVSHVRREDRVRKPVPKKKQKPEQLKLF